jgi:hypothetical protein
VQLKRHIVGCGLGEMKRAGAVNTQWFDPHCGPTILECPRYNGAKHSMMYGTYADDVDSSFCSTILYAKQLFILCLPIVTRE